ncbi:DUF3592 domain-containing protein [Streptomyces sp. NPDC058092]|uniref:DUF3592 domain-containing protein n=1 Tax=Streptomyces sp. NPDC058092 TaxID=3346336 RepID=UPI0036E9848C
MMWLLDVTAAIDGRIGMTGALVYVLVLTVLCVRLGVAATHSFRRHRACLRLKASGVETTGQCTSLSWRQDDVSVRFSYTLADGTKYEADSFHVSRTSFSPGSTFPIVYDPANSAVAEVADLLSEAVRFHRLALVAITPVLLLNATLDVWLARAGLL